MIELTRQKTNQPEREFLEIRENREIRKIRNNKQKCKKPKLSKDSVKRKKKVRKTKNKKNENKTAQAKANPEQNPIKTDAKRQVCFGRMSSAMRAMSRKETDEITPGCVDRVTCVVRSCDTMRVTICKEWAAI